MQNGKIALKVSDKIELRLPDPKFADDLFALVDSQREYLSPWLSWVDTTVSVGQIQDFLRTSKNYNLGGQRLTTFIFKKNEIAGSIGLVKIDKTHKLAEVGYWLREDFQGNGIITQSCQRLIEYTFKSMDINRIEIKVATLNLKSKAIPQKLGFTHEGTLREALFIRDTYFDLEIFSILRKEWKVEKKQ